MVEIGTLKTFLDEDSHARYTKYALYLGTGEVTQEMYDEQKRRHPELLTVQHLGRFPGYAMLGQSRWTPANGWHCAGFNLEQRATPLPPKTRRPAPYWGKEEAMKITLKTKVVHGTNRGGEDLFLVVKVASRRDPRTLDLAKEARTAFEKAWDSLPHENEIRVGEGAEDLFRVGQDGLSSEPTEQYDFKVEDTKERLWTEILDLVEGDEWKLTLKTGQYGVQKKIYVDGNAD